MPERSITLCRHPGCSERLALPGYCEPHRKQKRDESTKQLRDLGDRIPDKNKNFYHSSEWTKTSILHRIKEPLCRPCREFGIIVDGDLTHHDPDLTHLLQHNLNPFDDKYLVTVCTQCHQRELRKKRG